MMITRTSRFTGKVHTLDLPITDDEIDRYNAGALVQDAFPALSPAQREFILSGVTEEEWQDVIGEPDDEDAEAGDA